MLKSDEKAIVEALREFARALPSRDLKPLRRLADWVGDEELSTVLVEEGERRAEADKLKDK